MTGDRGEAESSHKGPRSTHASRTPTDFGSRRGQWKAAAVVAVGAIVAALVLPVLASAYGGDRLEAGAAFEASSNTSFTLADGWAGGDSDGLFVTLTKEGATLYPIGAVAFDEGQTLETVVDGYLAGFATDDSYSVTDPQPFTTDNGDEGLSFVAHADGEVSANWVIATGDQYASFLLAASDESWGSVEADVEEMVMSVVITEGDGS